MSLTVRNLIDIAVVFAVSALAMWLEGVADQQGWVDVGDDARGVSAVLAGAVTAVSLVLARGGTLADIGLRAPNRWTIALLQATAVLIVFAVGQNFAPLLVSLIAETPPPPDFSRYEGISGNLRAAVTLWLILIGTAAIPEEIIYRGFLMGRLQAMFGPGVGGGVLTVLVQAAIFGSIHYEWGVGGMLMTAVMGLIWGTAYLLCNRNLWVVIIAHSGGHAFLAAFLYSSGTGAA